MLEIDEIMENYDYSERISHNDKRIAELKGSLYTTKLSIKALEKENERCFEAMNNLTHPLTIDKKIKYNFMLEKENERCFEAMNNLTHPLTIDKKIKYNFMLEKELKEATKTIKKLKNENEQLKTNVEYLETKLHDYRVEKLCEHTPNDDVILSKNFGKENVFDKIMEE